MQIPTRIATSLAAALLAATTPTAAYAGNGPLDVFLTGDPELDADVTVVIQHPSSVGGSFFSGGNFAEQASRSGDFAGEPLGEPGISGGGRSPRQSDDAVERLTRRYPQLVKPPKLGPCSTSALQDIKMRLDTADLLRSSLVGSYILGLLLSSPEETMATGLFNSDSASWDPESMISAFRQVDPIVRSAIRSVAESLIVTGISPDGNKCSLSSAEDAFWRQLDAVLK